MRPGASAVECQEDEHRDRHATGPGHRRKRDAPPLPQRSHVELAPRLQPDYQEEERHQALAHPLPEVHRDALASNADRELGAPEGLVGLRPRRVGPGERCDRRAQQDQRTRGLRAEEVADRRCEVPRPCGALRKGPCQGSGSGSHLPALNPACAPPSLLVVLYGRIEARTVAPAGAGAPRLSSPR